MSPPPRKVTDEDVFAAVVRVMERVGPRELSLAAIAAEAGVSASALVQRFGSRHGLQVALAERAAESSAGMLEGLRKGRRSPLAVVRAYAECMGDLAETPAALARSLAYLQADLTDEALRAPLERQSAATRAGLAGVLREAVAAGEL